jgi:hypothetical protein
LAFFIFICFGGVFLAGSKVTLFLAIQFCTSLLSDCRVFGLLERVVKLLCCFFYMKQWEKTPRFLLSLRLRPSFAARLIRSAQGGKSDRVKVLQ